MILIVSANYESSTSSVAEWLLYYKKKYTIITETNTVSDILCTEYNKGKGGLVITTTSNEQIDFKKISAVWYRRGRFNFERMPQADIDIINEKIAEEWNIINDILMIKCKEKIYVGDYFKSSLNKIEVLKIAKEVGLNIPDTIITSNKGEINERSRSSKIINKTIGEVIHAVIDKKVYINRTVEIDAEKLPNTFFPSLFQKLIPKKYELRIFYLKGNFYAMAIFSQKDKKTTVDFRNYNYFIPNRTTPYKLPTEIKNKISRLMRQLNLKSGSIDMIVTDEGRFVFLEVNPDGQFGMVSYPCNYFLERRLSKYLACM
ncbi:MAG: grasp-with-spasm system ATP-grasp peptide maturase [Bacteroidia bacterium]|nr:grasp-with-spasm system ATP-grasp peptide maturase [Bacteroidia bacterium]